MTEAEDRVSCETAEGLIVDLLTGNLEGPDRARLHDHLAGCPGCRESHAATSALWRELGRLAPPAAAEDLPDRFTRLLGRGRGVGLGSTPRRRFHQVALALAAGLLLGFWGGWGLSRPAGGDGEGVAAAQGDVGDTEYLLLLREGPGWTIPDSTTEAALVAEYTAWARELARAGTLVAAEKLLNDGGRLVGSPAGAASVATPEADRVSGFFLVRARDYGQAVGLALRSPHVRHGGAVEIRAIDHGGER